MTPQVHPPSSSPEENAEALLRVLEAELQTKRQARAARASKRRFGLSALIGIIVMGAIGALIFLFATLGPASRGSREPAASQTNP